MGKDLYDLEVWEDILKQKHKRGNDSLISSKAITYLSEDASKRMKGHTTEREEIAMHICDKGLIIRVHKELKNQPKIPKYQSTSKEAIEKANEQTKGTSTHKPSGKRKLKSKLKTTAPTLKQPKF